MDYKIIITKRASLLLDKIVEYIVQILKNQQAAKNLLNEINQVLLNLESSPEIYPLLIDPNLKPDYYRKAKVSHYNYIIIFRIDNKSKKVYILGAFHSLEKYEFKI